MFKIPKRLGRSLDINGLQYSRKLVTLGFTVEGRTKYELAQEASEMEITLSEYIQMIVNSRKDQISATLKDRMDVLESTNQANEDYIKDLERERAKYCHPKLTAIYLQYKGQVINYLDINGMSQSRYINSEQDVLAIFCEIVKF